MLMINYNCSFCKCFYCPVVSFNHLLLNIAAATTATTAATAAAAAAILV